MCNISLHLPPIAELIGLIENRGELNACSLVFILGTECMQSPALTYGHLISAVKFTELQGAIPALSPHWWARVGDSESCLRYGKQGDHKGIDLRSVSELCAPIQNELLPPDFGALIGFQNAETGEAFVITVATLLQCLCIAEEQLIVPPFEPVWSVVCIPTILRERSKCTPLREMMQ